MGYVIGFCLRRDVAQGNIVHQQGINSQIMGFGGNIAGLIRRGDHNVIVTLARIGVGKLYKIAMVERLHRTAVTPIHLTGQRVLIYITNTKREMLGIKF